MPALSVIVVVVAGLVLAVLRAAARVAGSLAVRASGPLAPELDEPDELLEEDELDDELLDDDELDDDPADTVSEAA